MSSKHYIEPFHWTDLLYFSSQEPYPGDEMAKTLQAKGPAYTIVVGEGLGAVPVASGGIAQLWPEVGEVWTCLGPWAKTHKFVVVRFMKKFVDEQTKFYRIQAYVRKNEPSWLHLAQAIGLDFECNIKAYFPGRIDAALYSKVR